MCSNLAENGKIVCDVATQKATGDEIEFTVNEPQVFFKKLGSLTESYTAIKQKRDMNKSQFLFPNVNLIFFLFFFSFLFFSFLFSISSSNSFSFLLFFFSFF